MSRCATGHEFSSGLSACPNCGQPPISVCPSGHAVTAGLRFCTTCGGAVLSEVASAPTAPASTDSIKRSGLKSTMKSGVSPASTSTGVSAGVSKVDPTPFSPPPTPEPSRVEPTFGPKVVAPIESVDVGGLDLGAPSTSGGGSFCAACGASKGSALSPCPVCAGSGLPSGGTTWTPPPSMSGSSRPPAPFSKRFLAYFLEHLIANFILGILCIVLIFAGSAMKGSGAILFLLLGLSVYVFGSLVPMIVFTVQVGKTGQSWGMRRVGIRCISEATGLPIGVGAAFLRLIFHAVDSLTLGIGWIRPAWDVKRQTFADTFAHTIVVIESGR